MIPSYPPTYELMKACLPTRTEKRKIAAQLRRKDESIIYKWCEDPDGSGRPNPLDMLESILEHARIYHPIAAYAVVNRLIRGNAAAASRTSTALPIQDLVTRLQPLSEKEAMEAIREFSRALRDLLQGETVDLRTLVKEVDEAMRQFQYVQDMLRAVIDAELLAEGE